MGKAKHSGRTRGGDGHRRNKRYRPDRQRFLPQAGGPARCAGCAFTPGTVAFAQPLTLLKAKLCAQVLEPFLCHAPLQTGPDGVARLPERERKLCQGWLDLMDRLRERGYYERQTEAERLTLREYLRTVLALEDDMLDGYLVGLEDVPPEIRAAVRPVREA